MIRLLQEWSLYALMRFAGTLLIIGLLAWYAYVQGRLFLEGPILTLNPHESTLTDGYHTMISGTAHNVTSLTLNGRPIFVDDTGRFSELLVIEHGYTIITLEAKDRFGRIIKITEPMVYAPAYTDTSE